MQWLAATDSAEGLVTDPFGEQVSRGADSRTARWRLAVQAERRGGGAAGGFARGGLLLVVEAGAVGVGAIATTAPKAIP